MTCHDVEETITAYLDGDLDAPAASALRGHLHTCAACRRLSEDHARVSGVLADLEPIDPPAVLWDGVLARLAEAEKADAQRPRWRITLASLWARIRPHLVPGSALVVAAAAVVVWMAREPSDQVVAVQLEVPPVESHPAMVTIPATDTRDIEQTLAAEARRIDAKYSEAVTELLDDVAEDKDEWPAARRRMFDAELERLQAAVDAVPASRTRVAEEDPFDAAEAATDQRARRERAWQRLVAYLQRAAIGELEEARR